jgi:hypothetical protein
VFVTPLSMTRIKLNYPSWLKLAVFFVECAAYLVPTLPGKKA